MALDPSTLCARTAAGDAELAAPRNGLAIAQRRLLTLLDHPLALDELAARPGLQPERLERDLARLAEHGLVEIHRPAGATGPLFPLPARRLASPIQLPPPPTVAPTTQGPMRYGPAGTATSHGGAVVAGRRVRHGRAVLVGFASLAAVGIAVWFFGTPSSEPPAPPAPPPRQAKPPAGRGQAAAPQSLPQLSPQPKAVIEPVRVLLAADPPPGRPAAGAPAEPTATPTLVAAAAPVALETRIAPLTLAPLTREVPEFPREALAAGVHRGTVKARVSIDATGRVAQVDIVDAAPPRVFDRAVSRSLARWTYAPGASTRTTDVEIAFLRE